MLSSSRLKDTQEGQPGLRYPHRPPGGRGNWAGPRKSLQGMDGVLERGMPLPRSRRPCCRGAAERITGQGQCGQGFRGSVWPRWVCRKLTRTGVLSRGQRAFVWLNGVTETRRTAGCKDARLGTILGQSLQNLGSADGEGGDSEATGCNGWLGVRGEPTGREFPWEGMGKTGWGHALQTADHTFLNPGA